MIEFTALNKFLAKFRKGKIIIKDTFIELVLPCGYRCPMLKSELDLAKYLLELDRQQPGAGKDFLESRQIRSLNTFICNKNINYSNPELSLVYYEGDSLDSLSKSIENEYDCEVIKI